MWFCRNFIFSSDIAVLQNFWFVVFRNFRVISMWFAVFLCYSVRYLYVIQCSFAVFLPPLRPPHQMATNDMKMGWYCNKKGTIPNTIVKYRLSYKALTFSLCKIQMGNYTPTPTLRGLGSSLQAVRGDPGIFQIGGRMRGLQTSKYCNCFKPLFSPF